MKQICASKAVHHWYTLVAQLASKK